MHRRHKCVLSGPVPLCSCSAKPDLIWVTMRTVNYRMGVFVSVYWLHTHTVIWQPIHSYCYPRSGSGLGAFRFLVSYSKNWNKGWCLPVTVWLRSQACEEMIHQSLASTFSPMFSVPPWMSCIFPVIYWSILSCIFFTPPFLDLRFEHT